MVCKVGGVSTNQFLYHLARTISRVLASLLQHVVGKIISPSQSAFIKSRSIIDNVVVAQEIFHFMNTSLARNSYWGALKLDMSKANDRVE